jgi:hypothetical protein
MSDSFVTSTVERSQRCLGESQNCLDKAVVSIAELHRHVRYSQQVLQASWDLLQNLPLLADGQKAATQPIPSDEQSRIAGSVIRDKTIAVTGSKVTQNRS